MLFLSFSLISLNSICCNIYVDMLKRPKYRMEKGGGGKSSSTCVVFTCSISIIHRYSFYSSYIFTTDLYITASVVTIVVAEGSNQRQSIVSFHNRFVAENSGIFLFTGTVLLLHYKGKSLQLPRKMAERNGVRSSPIWNQCCGFNPNPSATRSILVSVKRLRTVIHKQPTNGYLYLQTLQKIARK